MLAITPAKDSPCKSGGATLSLALSLPFSSSESPPLSYFLNFTLLLSVRSHGYFSSSKARGPATGGRCFLRAPRDISPLSEMQIYSLMLHCAILPVCGRIGDRLTAHSPLIHALALFICLFMWPNMMGFWASRSAGIAGDNGRDRSCLSYRASLASANKLCIFSVFDFYLSLPLYYSVLLLFIELFAQYS